MANTTDGGCPGGNEGCERPGEGAGWGVDGGPVIGCGALFISWSSAWGGRCGPVYKYL